MNETKQVATIKLHLLKIFAIRLIKAYVHSEELNMFLFDVDHVSAMLSHWSLGHKSRHAMLIHSDTYLHVHTEAFQHQRLRTWTENVSVINAKQMQHTLVRQNT